MSLDLNDLNMDELRFVMSLLRICYMCEKEIPITDNDNGYLDCCGCIYHRSCPSPRIREYHDPSICSLDLKRTIIRGFLKNQDLSTAILQKLRNDCPNLPIVLDSTKNSTVILNNEEIVLLIRIFRICYKCGKTISDIHHYSPSCGCICHRSNCPFPQKRTSHPNSCSYTFRAETVKMYKNSISGNFNEFFRKHMIQNCPSLIKAIRFKNQISAPPTQIELLRQELYNAKQEILQANDEKKSLREELVKANQTVHKTKKKNETLQHELEQATQALNNAKNEQRLNLEESKKRVADVESEKDMLRLLNEKLEKNSETSKQILANAEREKEMLRFRNEELEKNLESTTKQFESANMRLAVITDEINNLRRQSDAARNELPVKEQKEKELRHELKQANQALNNAKNEQRMNLEESSKRLADVEREKDMLRLLNEELEKNFESTKKQFESANTRLAVITHEINSLRRQSDAARNELPVEEQKSKQIEDEEIVASDKSLLNFEWKKFEERFVALQEKTELLAQQTITRRSAAVMRENNPKILKASETADEVKNSVIDTLRSETNRIVDTEQELFPHSLPQTFSASDSHINDVNLLD